MTSQQLREILKNAKWFYDVKVIVNNEEIQNNVSTLAIIEENKITLKIIDSKCRFNVSHLDFDLKFDKNNCKVCFEYNNQIYYNFNIVVINGLERVLVII